LDKTRCNSKNVINTRLSKIHDCRVYILKQVISQSLIKTQDLQPKTSRVTVKGTQAARIFGDDGLGASRLCVSQACIGQMIGNVWVSELQSTISTRVGAFFTPEQLLSWGGQDTRQQSAWRLMARRNA
jgi:hypothetical protein